MSAPLLPAVLPLVSRRLLPCTRGDLPGLYLLLNSGSPSCASSTAAELPRWWPRFRALRDVEGRPVACGAVVPLDDERVELRGIAVMPTHRGEGLGARVVDGLVDLAEADGHQVMCVTRCPSFFRRLGFRRLGFGPAAPSWLNRRRQLVDGDGRCAMARPMPVALDAPLELCA